jgi:CMP-N-acetylneuraminic acid synthetase
MAIRLGWTAMKQAKDPKKQVVGLIFGRGGSSSIKNKNIMPVCGRPMMEWPILAGLQSGLIDRFFVSTDSPAIGEIATKHGLERIDRPSELATNAALFDDALLHAYRLVCEKIGGEPEMVVSFFCNAATVTTDQVRQVVENLRKHPDVDSSATVSKLTMYTPLRAKKIEGGLVRPSVPIEMFPNASCSRDSAGETYFVDASVWALRPRCFDYSYGELPYRWLGRKIMPVVQEFGCDVDSEWQLAATEWWLKKYRASEIPASSSGR